MTRLANRTGRKTRKPSQHQHYFAANAAARRQPPKSAAAKCAGCGSDLEPTDGSFCRTCLHLPAA